MNLDLSDRGVIITGGTRGLGLATARILVEEGARVLVASRDPANVERAVAGLGDRAAGLVADVREPDTPGRLLAAVRDHAGRFDGALISHAGTAPGAPSELDDDSIDDALDGAVKAPVRLLRELVRAARGVVSLVVVTAVTSLQPHAAVGGSSLTRPGVWGYAKALAHEVGPRGIRINAVLPGRFATERVDMLDEIRARRDDRTVDEVRSSFLAETALGRLGEPHELGRVAAFLLSPASSYVTGVALPVDGGFVRGL